MPRIRQQPAPPLPGSRPAPLLQTVPSRPTDGAESPTRPGPERLYRLLLEAHGERPRVLGTFPTLPLERGFKDLGCPHLDPATFNTTFRLLHDVLPVAHRLHLWRLPVHRRCMLCPAHAITITSETVEHLFMRCPVVEPARRLLASCLSRAADLTLTLDLIRFGPLRSDVTDRPMVLMLLSEFRHVVWVCRNKVRFDSKQPHHQDFTRMLRARLFSRIHVDHRRLSPDQFSRLWLMTSLCRLDSKGRPVPCLDPP